MSESLLIRPARIADREAILACQRAAIGAIPVGYPYDAPLLAAWKKQPTRGMDSLILASRYFVAENEQGEIVATAGWAPAAEHGEGIALLRSVFAHPKTHGQGLGRQIAAAAELAARRAGFRTMRVAAAFSAVAFYRRLGYRVQDAGRLEAVGATIDLLLMDKRLTPAHREAAIFAAASNDNRPDRAGLRV
ncbi:MAG: GNAT family N-acetyltransferase [Reyranellaceae bacterium]